MTERLRDEVSYGWFYPDGTFEPERLPWEWKYDHRGIQIAESRWTKYGYQTTNKDYLPRFDGFDIDGPGEDSWASYYESGVKEALFAVVLVVVIASTLAYGLGDSFRENRAAELKMQETRLACRKAGGSYEHFGELGWHCIRKDKQ